MRYDIDDPRERPVLHAAIAAAEELGCRVGKGYAMGHTRLGLHLLSPEGLPFLVEFHVKRLTSPRSTAKDVRKAFERICTPK
jgi:hypothetical protein